MLSLILYQTILSFNGFGKETFENNEGKGENVGCQHFVLFQQFFLPPPKTISTLDSPSFCLKKIFLFGHV